MDHRDGVLSSFLDIPGVPAQTSRVWQLTTTKIKIVTLTYTYLFTFGRFLVMNHHRRIGILLLSGFVLDSARYMWGIMWIRLLVSVWRSAVYPRTSGLSSTRCRNLSRCALKMAKLQSLRFRRSLGRALNNWGPWCEKLPSRIRLTLGVALRGRGGILQVRPFREFSKWSICIPLFPSREMLGTCLASIFQT